MGPLTVASVVATESGEGAFWASDSRDRPSEACRDTGPCSIAIDFRYGYDFIAVVNHDELKPLVRQPP